MAFRILQGLGGLNELASQGFLEERGFGWLAHIPKALIVVVIMLIGSTKRWSVPVVGSLVLMLLVILLYHSKYVAFFPIFLNFQILCGSVNSG